MDKFTYRLDLTEEEFNLIKNNLNENILSKLKKIKVSQNKSDSMKRATFQRSEIARAKFFDAILDLSEKDADEETYTIVGTFETDPLHGKISNESPVGKALIGAHTGDVVEVEMPMGIMKYKVLEIQRNV